MLQRVVLFPAGQAPPELFAVSITDPEVALSCKAIPVLVREPEKIWSAAISFTVSLSVRSSKKYPPAGIVPASVMEKELPEERVQPVILIEAVPGL